jgi:hypothetical protein
MRRLCGSGLSNNVGKLEDDLDASLRRRNLGCRCGCGEEERVNGKNEACLLGRTLPLLLDVEHARRCCGTGEL